ncbi:MAG: VirE protein, partial [Bacteroidaceae bacterium]|nr:VirE protein [Bacteroidaceae bacterium]
MSFGIGENVRSEVRVCTPDLFHGALDNPEVGRTCAEIEDALEACRRGEMAKEEYETRKAGLKKRLPIFTFHATFRNGRRKNEDAVPSGLCIYDLDHIPNPQAKWAEMEARKAELGIVMAHITPSAEGLRLVFVVPKGMTLAQAQGWMAERLGDKQYDTCVKDFARCSFAVPRDYVLYLDEARLFGERPEPEAEEETPCPECPESPACGEPMPVPTFGEKFQGIAYEDIVSVLEEQMGGRPEHGSRNNFIFSMACHLRYICDDDPEWIAQVLPTYGESREKWMATIRSACARNQTKAMPRIMKRTLDICKERTDGPEKSEESLPEPPKMPRILPRLIRLLVSKTPDIYRPAVAHAVFPALGAHLWQTTFRYI